MDKIVWPTVFIWLFTKQIFLFSHVYIWAMTSVYIFICEAFVGMTPGTAVPGIIQKNELLQSNSCLAQVKIKSNSSLTDV